MQFVQKVLDDREKHTIQKRNLSIEIDKKIADLLLSSQMVSGWYICIFNSLVCKGKSHKLLRKTLLKDKNIKKKESEQELKEALLLVPELKKQIYELQDNLEEKEHELENKSKNSEILAKLFKMGLIDAEGNPIEKINF